MSAAQHRLKARLLALTEETIRGADFTPADTAQQIFDLYENFNGFLAAGNIEACVSAEVLDPLEAQILERRRLDFCNEFDFDVADFDAI